MIQQIMTGLTDIAVREAVNAEAASLVPSRLSIIVPLLDMLVGQRILVTASDLKEQAYANALGRVLSLPGEKIKIRPALISEIEELRGQHEDYRMTGEQILLSEVLEGEKETGADPMRSLMGQVRPVLMPAMDLFASEYGQPLCGFGDALYQRIMALPFGLICILVSYIARNNAAGIERIAPFLRKLAQALPVGVLDDEPEHTWTVIVE